MDQSCPDIESQFTETLAPPGWENCLSPLALNHLVMSRYLCLQRWKRWANKYGHSLLKAVKVKTEDGSKTKMTTHFIYLATCCLMLRVSEEEFEGFRSLLSLFSVRFLLLSLCTWSGRLFSIYFLSIGEVIIVFVQWFSGWMSSSDALLKVRLRVEHAFYKMTSNMLAFCQTWTVGRFLCPVGEDEDLILNFWLNECF